MKNCIHTVQSLISRGIGSLLAIAGLANVFLLTGCAQRPFEPAIVGVPQLDVGYRAEAPANFDPAVAEETGEMPDVRRLPMFLGATGKVVSWDDLLAACAWADVIMLGEEHDDGVGHAVQRAVMQDLAARHQRVTLSMEMLERDEQTKVDDYLDGIIDAKSFAELTHSERWAGEGSWENWYQPIIDAAKDSGNRVVAANAPRRYVRLARSQDFDRLRALPKERRDFVAFPKGNLNTPYRDRFVALMTDMSGDEGDEAHSVDTSFANAIFRSQITWDATMADSIDHALKDGANKVVHLVGRFHVGFNGGTIEQLERRRPGVRILNVVMSKDDALELNATDHNLADIVIYTGKRLETEEEAPEEEADGEDVTPESSPDAADPESLPTDHPSAPDARSE